MTSRQASASPRSTGAVPKDVVAGLRISHPTRLVYPDPPLTKLDIARYYERVAHWMVPHVRARPLTLVHCPSGLPGGCRYMRHSKVWGPAALRRVRIPERTKLGEYLVADTPQALVALAQMGVLEIHTWNALADDVERPNRIVWDLDPGPRVSWRQTVAAARQLREVLRLLGLEVWPKTTGGNGLHVVAPLAPSRRWDECLSFARAIARLLEGSAPALYTTAFATRGREARILVDYLRNNRTNTTIAAFSTRARPGAPVAMPLRWEDLRAVRPSFTVQGVLRRLTRCRTDPWDGYWECGQRLTSRMVAAVTALASPG